MYKYRHQIPPTEMQNSSVSNAFQKDNCWATYFRSIAYAEDVVLSFFFLKTNLELVLDLLSSTFKRYHLENNISKTKKMIFSHPYMNEEYPKTIVSINYRLCYARSIQDAFGLKNILILKYVILSLATGKEHTTFI